LIELYLNIWVNNDKGIFVKNSLKALFLISLPFVSANASTWYVGASVGRTFTNNKGTIEANYPRRYQSDQKKFDSGFLSASAFVGQSIPVADVGKVLVEGFYAYNTEKQEATSLGGRIADIKVIVERSKTFGFNVGFARPIDDGLDVFAKVGAVISQFNTKLTDITPRQDYAGRDSQWGWGFAPSLGIQKTIDSVSLGLSYSYYMYQQFTAKSTDIATQTTYSNKLTPRYHVVEATITKHI